MGGEVKGTQKERGWLTKKRKGFHQSSVMSRRGHEGREKRKGETGEKVGPKGGCWDSEKKNQRCFAPDKTDGGRSLSINRGWGRQAKN